MAPPRSDEAKSAIKEKHKLLINPQPNKLVLLLKYPTRQPDELYCAAFGNKPLELRIKPKCGLVEIDVPIDFRNHFDRTKGVKFGLALQQKAHTGDPNSFYGVSSGLQPVVSRRDEDESLEGHTVDELLDAFDEAIDDGYVMKKITLGGRIEPFKDGDPIYMLATFEEGTSTWTPLNGMVMLRPQFEHLDALRLQQPSGSRSTLLADNNNNNDQHHKKELKAEDVNMTVKDTEDDEAQDDLYGGMAETLKTLHAMAEEPWQRLQWIDSDETLAYTMWTTTLVHPTPTHAPPLTSSMTQDEYLTALSCPRIDPIHKGRTIMPPPPPSTADTTAANDDSDPFSLTSSPSPPSPSLPTPKTKYLIELTARALTAQPDPTALPTLYQHARRTLRANAAYAFLRTRDPLHAFFLWRAQRNREGRGWSLRKLRRRVEGEEEEEEEERSAEDADRAPSAELMEEDERAGGGGDDAVAEEGEEGDAGEASGGEIPPAQSAAVAVVVEGGRTSGSGRRNQRAGARGRKRGSRG